MTTPEKSFSEQPKSNDAVPDNQILSYVEIFCRAMAQLNAVSLEQTEGLLNIAVKAAEKFHSINPSGMSALPENEELTEFINQMKNTADRLNPANRESTPGETAHAAPNPEVVLAVVEQSLGNAIRNSTSNQQALNEIGAAILARAASLLLSSNENKSAVES